MSPFTAHLPDVPFPGGTKVTTDAIGLGVIGLTSVALVGHVATSLYKGRIQKNLLRTSGKGKHRRSVKKVKTFHQYRLKKP